jgi:hypothetical protein
VLGPGDIPFTLAGVISDAELFKAAADTRIVTEFSTNFVRLSQHVHHVVSGTARLIVFYFFYFLSFQHGAHSISRRLLT